MLAQFGYIGILLIVAIGFTIIIPVLPMLLRLIGLIPQKKNSEKNMQYECGMTTIGKTWVQFNFRYYFFAVLFVLLDMLTIFLYPWAVNVKDLGAGGLVAVGVFLLILTVGYLYAWRKGALQWK
ncbi:MAG: NADH-quinone oxidoreductase subunit A [Dehalococcoidia bacterium]|nr:NADH-quinone oxidoreductase subunit A [Dehalococcoidia bacterium]MDD5493941.1 NADH-quinone oxidoreductase subunit A [Dehalococcoidia bacterium]